MKTVLRFTAVSLWVLSLYSPAYTDPVPGNGGAILGRVLERATASPIGQAAVKTRNQATGFEQQTATAFDGTFFFAALPAGLYTITAIQNGFQTESVSNYPVQSGSSAAAPANLELAGMGSGRMRERPIATEPRPVLPQISDLSTPAATETIIRWDSGSGIAASRALSPNRHSERNGFSLLELRPAGGPFPRQRNPELSPDQILVVFEDDEAQQQTWLLIPDPRILRAEIPEPGGELTGQVFYRTSAEFAVAVPGDPRLISLKFYLPEWTGRFYSFRLLGSVQLR